MSRHDTVIARLEREITAHKEAATKAEKNNVRTRSINCVNRKLKQIKSIRETGSINNAVLMELSQSERFRG